MSQILLDYLVLLVDVYYVDKTSIVSGVKLLINSVPQQTCINGLIGINQFNLEGVLSCFEPLKSLIIRDCKDKIFLSDQQYLDDAVSVSALLFMVQT